MLAWTDEQINTCLVLEDNSKIVICSNREAMMLVLTVAASDGSTNIGGGCGCCFCRSYEVLGLCKLLC